MHKLALLMEDIARASVSAVVGLFMLGVAIVIGIIVLVTIMTVLKMAINDISVLQLPAKGRQDKKRVHRRAEKGRRRTDSGNQGNAGKERRKASEEAAKKE